MLNEVILIILLSIFTTAMMLSIAQVLKRIWNIKHPKNNFFIYLVVLLTALSIIPFSVIAFSGSNHEMNPPEIQIPELKGKAISDSTILTRNQNITYSSTIKEIPAYEKSTSQPTGITRYLQKISWSELIILDEDQEKENNKEQIVQLTEKNSINASQFIKKTLSLALFDPGESTEAQVNQIFTNLLINQELNNNKPLESQPISKQLVLKNEKIQPIQSDISDQSIFYFGLIGLFLISCFYIVTSLLLGKKHTIKSLQAKPCTNKYINHMVKELAKEFNIKMPRIYLYDGAPNAFVFGYPLTLAISSQLYQLLTNEEFEAAIRHEIAHIKNHDIFIKPILQGLRIFFFYNPFVHYISYQIMKNREILADASTFQTKKQKIALMEALIKINEKSMFSSKHLTFSKPIALLSYNSKKLTLTERFSNLFSIASKKSALTILASFIIIAANLSIFIIAGNIEHQANEKEFETISTSVFSIDNTYYQESLTYTKIVKDSKIYFGVIVHRNLYNYISMKSSPDLLNNSFIDDNYPTIPSIEHCNDFNSF